MSLKRVTRLFPWIWEGVYHQSGRYTLSYFRRTKYVTMQQGVYIMFVSVVILTRVLAVGQFYLWKAYV